MSTLKSQLSKLDVESSMLDSIVHDGASRIASRVNNEGMAEQLRFLEDQVGMSEQDIIGAVKSEVHSGE